MENEANACEVEKACKIEEPGKVNELDEVCKTTESGEASLRESEIAAGSTSECDAFCAEDAAFDEDLLNALEGRAEFYETLAALYFKPLTLEQIETMAQADFSAYAEINELFASGFNDITRYLKKRNTGTRQELAVDFTSSFGGVAVYEGKSAVPYKSVFTSSDGLMYQEGYQEVFKALKEESVKLRDGLDLPDDHLSFMCQFMALLSRRIAKSYEAKDFQEALRLVESSQNFLEKHIVSWFPAFRELSLKLIKTRFYRGVLKITQGFFELDKETLSDMASVMEGSAQ
jgi:putative dimethyl sulfoxide reductase chaperone